MSRKKTSPEEQYRLIMECRSSGLTDAQWCNEHDIKPSTFYNWVSRLRKKACEIPESSYNGNYTQVLTQDIVKLDILPDAYESGVHNCRNEIQAPAIDSAPVVIHLRGASISLQNNVDPSLLHTLLQVVGGQLC